MTVMLSEMLVDWLKHAFITKFNHIRPSVYERYTDVLCRDLASGSGVGRHRARKVCYVDPATRISINPWSLAQHAYVDQSPLVARRLGFASLPLAVLAIIIGSQLVSLVLSMQADTRAAAHPWPIPPDDDMVRYAKWAVLGVLAWACAVVGKLIMGVNLVGYAVRRRAGMEARAKADAVNDFGRDPIGEGPDEKVGSHDYAA